MERSSTRQHIVEVASDLFYQQGYNLTGVNEIIKKAEIAKATLYSHFGSKDEICLAFLRHKNELFVENLESYLEAKKKKKSQMLLIFDFLKAFYKQEDFNGCWCINTYAEIPRDKAAIRAEIQAQKLALIDLMFRKISEEFPKKTKKAKEGLAKQVYLIYEGAVSESHIHQEEWPILSAIQICQKIIH